ncbi:hypothetical protein AB0L06_42570 [Spirillospora sp. NPDC052269]
MHVLKISVTTGAVLAAGIALAGPATADTGHQVGGATSDRGAAVSAAGTGSFHRTGKIHRFTARSVRGAAVWGTWYWARDKYGAFVWLTIKVKDTRADGKSAGYCYYLTGPKVNLRNRCGVNTLGARKTWTDHWAMEYWNQDHMKIRAAVGKLDRKRKVFNTSAEGAWLKLR